MLADILDHLCGEIIAHSYSRQPDQNAMRKIRLSVRKIVTDSVATSKGKKRTRWASIHKNANHYSNSRYQNEDISFRIHVARVYADLLALGYLEEIKSGVHTQTARYLTRYEATEKLLELFDSETQRLLPVEMPVIENPETIRLRLRDDEGKFLADYPETGLTRQMRENLLRINNALSRSWFDLELTDSEFEQLEEDMSDSSKKHNNLNPSLRLQDRRIHRVFNSLDFDKGGRFYGGWWQQIPRAYRAYILIDGKRTEEVDFSSLHPTLLYARQGLVLEKDAYSLSLLPRKAPPDKTLDNFRDTIKTALNAMLNAGSDMQQPPRGLDHKDWGVGWKELKEAILERHQPIADQFFTGTGLQLQYEDSLIAEELMLEFIDMHGIVPILPVHDSFICHHGYRDELKALMRKKFKQRFGVSINVKAKARPFRPTQTIDDDLDSLLSYKDRSYDLRLDHFRNLSGA